MTSAHTWLYSKLNQQLQKLISKLQRESSCSRTQRWLSDKQQAQCIAGAT